MVGLPNKDIEMITEVLGDFSEIEQVILFGSRAMGNHKKGSDVDLALVGKKINAKILNRIRICLNEESPLPYFFDLLNYHDISNGELKKHIDENGQLLYEKF